MTDETDVPVHAGADEVARLAAAKPAAPRRKAAAKRKPARRWSEKAQALFLATLADTANVAASARKAKLAESTFRRHRQTDPEFAARWAAALREGYQKLEAEMLARALAGVEKDVWHGGKKVGTVHEYNDRTALALLNLHRAAVTGTRSAPVGPMPVADARDLFRARLAEMNRRMGGAG